MWLAGRGAVLQVVRLQKAVSLQASQQEAGKWGTWLTSESTAGSQRVFSETVKHASGLEQRASCWHDSAFPPNLIRSKQPF